MLSDDELKLRYYRQVLEDESPPSNVREMEDRVVLLSAVAHLQQTALGLKGEAYLLVPGSMMETLKLSHNYHPLKSGPGPIGMMLGLDVFSVTGLNTPTLVFAKLERKEEAPKPPAPTGEPENVPKVNPAEGPGMTGPITFTPNAYDPIKLGPEVKGPVILGEEVPLTEFTTQRSSNKKH